MGQARAEALPFLKYCTHGATLLVSVDLISIALDLIPISVIDIGLAAGVLCFFTLLFSSGVLVGLANSAMNEVLWKDVGTSIRSLLMDGLAFSVIAGLVSPTYSGLTVLAQFLAETAKQPIVAPVAYSFAYVLAAFVLGNIGREIAEGWGFETPFEIRKEHHTIGVIGGPFGINPTIHRGEDRGK